MDGHTIPPSPPCTVIRTCETSRLQRQLLARAYQQVCPEVRRPVHARQGLTPTVERRADPSLATHAVAGA
jgi:hypothetical protein